MWAPSYLTAEPDAKQTADKKPPPSVCTQNEPLIPMAGNLTGIALGELP